MNGKLAALQFESIPEALLFCREEHLPRVEVVYQHSGSQKLFSLPSTDQKWVFKPAVNLPVAQTANW